MRINRNVFPVPVPWNTFALISNIGRLLYHSQLMKGDTFFQKFEDFFQGLFSHSVN